MFQMVVHQLENSKKALYSEESCRIFLMQAYQELTYLRMQAEDNSEDIDEVLARFVTVEEDALKAYDNLHHLTYGDVNDEIQELIDFINKKDGQLV